MVSVIISLKPSSTPIMQCHALVLRQDNHTHIAYVGHTSPGHFGLVPQPGSVSGQLISLRDSRRW